MAYPETAVEVLPKPHSSNGTEKLWHEFWKPRAPNAASPGLRARVVLTQPMREARQFVVETGSGHHLLVDDAPGGSGPKPIELSPRRLPGAPRLTSSPC
jgi:hypothetical protein